MNKHILLVMKWLKDKDSVSQKELVKNSRDAWSDACVAHAAAHDAAATGLMMLISGLTDISRKQVRTGMTTKRS